MARVHDAHKGRIAAQWTLGGHRHYRAGEVARCLTGIGPTTRDEDPENSDIRRVRNARDVR